MLAFLVTALQVEGQRWECHCQQLLQRVEDRSTCTFIFASFDDALTIRSFISLSNIHKLSWISGFNLSLGSFCFINGTL